MDNCLPTLEHSIAAEPDSTGTTPFDLDRVTITRREHIELKCQAAQYQSLHARAIERIENIRIAHKKEMTALKAKCAALEVELEQTKAQLRGLRRQAFGTRSEQSRTVKPPLSGLKPEGAPAPRPRGQQTGWQGHGRTRQTNLPAREQIIDVDPCCCPQCGLGFVEMAGTQDSEVLEIEVKAYRRVIRRKRLRASCQCRVLPGIVTAPAPPQLFDRGKLGLSVMTEALLSKYRHGIPTHRLIEQWQDIGLPVAQGTLTGNLQQLLPLFTPLIQAGLKRLRASDAWHADETRWEVFGAQGDRSGYRHYLWVFQSADVAHFVMDPSRSASVPKAVLQGVTSGVLSADRYAAYQCYARSTPGVELALCWAHQRRDFLQVANQCPEHALWALRWIDRIAELYALHHKRRQLATTEDVDEYKLIDELLNDHVTGMQMQCHLELQQPALPRQAHAVLRSMTRHWRGLLTFVEHPEIELDNNRSERSLRPAVVGRKNYYGSGSQASGQLVATMLSLFTTLDLWRINPRQWLTEYLHACALAGGQPPIDCTPFIPWQMDAARLAGLRQSNPLKATA